MALRGDALALIGAGDGVKLAALHLVLNRVEVFGNERNSLGIAHEHHFVGQVFGFQMEVEARTVFIDDQFGWGKILTHRFYQDLRLI